MADGKRDTCADCKHYNKTSVQPGLGSCLPMGATFEHAVACKRFDPVASPMGVAQPIRVTNTTSLDADKPTLLSIDTDARLRTELVATRDDGTIVPVKVDAEGRVIWSPGTCPRCDACKHWREEVQVCERGYSNDSKQEDPTSLAVAYDREGDGAVLNTAPSFGCVQWAPKGDEK